MDSTPTGASSAGAGVPSTLVASRRVVVSRSMRGTIRQASNAARLARIVAPLPAPPAT